MRFFRNLLLLALLYCTCQQLLAQSVEQQTDSLLLELAKAPTDTDRVNLQLDLAQIHYWNQPLRSLDYARTALRLSESIDYSVGITDAYVSLFTAHYYKGSNADSLKQYASLLETYCLEKGDSTGLISAYWSYAMYYGNVGKSDKEIEAFLKALELVKKYRPDPELEGGLLNNIGNIFYSKNQKTRALGYFQQALQLVKNGGTRANLLSSIGTIYLEELNKLDSANILFTEAIQLYQAENDIAGIGSVNVETAKYLQLKGQTEKAEQLLLETLQLLQKNNLNLKLPALFGELSKLYYQKEQYNKAISYGEKSIAIAEEQENFYEVEPYYALLHASYAATGQYEQAYTIREAHQGLKDSINNLKLLSTVEELQTKFKVRQKIAENQLLKTQQLTDQKTIQHQTFLALVLLLGLLLLGTLALVIYRSNQRKNKYNQELEATVSNRTAALQSTNQELEQTNYELRILNAIASHDVKEPIRNIGLFAGLIFSKLPDQLKQSLGSHFNTIKNSTSQLYTLIEDFSNYTKLSKERKLNIQEVDLNEILQAVEMSVAQIIEQKNGIVSYPIMPKVKSNPSMLHVALKNIIENGLRFNKSTPPRVELSFQSNNEYHELLIRDNGIGIAPEHQEQIFEMFQRLHNRADYHGSGVGLAIVKLVMNKLEGQLHVESEEGKGSLFTLRLPNIT